MRDRGRLIAESDRPRRRQGQRRRQRRDDACAPRDLGSAQPETTASEEVGGTEGFRLEPTAEGQTETGGRYWAVGADRPEPSMASVPQWTPAFCRKKGHQSSSSQPARLPSCKAG